MSHPRYKSRAWLAVRKQVLARDGQRCQIQAAGCLGRATEVDHIIRPEDGGSELHMTNLRASCKPCNVSKRNRQAAARARQADQRAYQYRTATQRAW